MCSVTCCCVSACAYVYVCVCTLDLEEANWNSCFCWDILILNNRNYYELLCAEGGHIIKYAYMTCVCVMVSSLHRTSAVSIHQWGTTMESYLRLPAWSRAIKNLVWKQRVKQVGDKWVNHNTASPVDCWHTHSLSLSLSLPPLQSSQPSPMTWSPWRSTFHDRVSSSQWLPRNHSCSPTLSDSRES